MNARLLLTSSLRSASLLAVALALPGCILETKLGDKPEGQTSEPADTDAPADTEGTIGASSATDAPSADTLQTTAGTDEPSADTLQTTAGTDEPVADCEGLDEAACAANAACMVRFGRQYDATPCPEDPDAYLGCIPQQACGEAGTTICDEAGVAYLLGDTCVPPGFSGCAVEDASLCPAGCQALDEAACLADVTCTAHYGSPHVEVDGAICVDYTQQAYLGCSEDGGACPPVVQVVCPVGQPGPVFDVPSGCIPPDHEPCEGAGTPPCE